MSTSSYRSASGKRTFTRRFTAPKRAKLTGVHPDRFVKRAEAVEEAEPYAPDHQFADFALDERIKRNIAYHKYVTPTPIQDQSIKPILAGQDLIGLANTGTGKTAAFLLPLLDKVLRNVRQERVIIIAPTRELALQIDAEFKAFAYKLGLHSAVCIGGANIGKQIYNLRRDPHFVIGTPGRLKDLSQQRQLDLSRFGNLVLDEVDRMLDMGFLRDIQYLIAQLPDQRQSLFFSATMPSEIKHLAERILKDPVTIQVKQGETSANVDQDIVRIPSGAQKIDVLKRLLAEDEYGKVIVFGQTKWGVEKLGRNLARDGFRAVAIHGNKSQSQRQRALEAFKRGEAGVLVATDVAARGLDISDVTHVINYDAPNSYDDYVHRIGRTGRAGKAGKALTFVS